VPGEQMLKTVYDLSVMQAGTARSSRSAMYSVRIGGGPSFTGWANLATRLRHAAGAFQERAFWNSWLAIVVSAIRLL
jgi:hypothetical protein